MSNSWKKDAKRNLRIFWKVGLPYTIIGVIVIFTGIYFLKRWFADNEYLTLILFLWIALFWFVYQPLFRKRVREYAKENRR